MSGSAVIRYESNQYDYNKGLVLLHLPLTEISTLTRMTLVCVPNNIRTAQVYQDKLQRDVQ